MLPYWLLFAVFAAGAMDYRRRIWAGRRRMPLIGAACAFTALMIGLRFEVGGDWINYL